MAANVEQELIEKVRALPPEQQEKVLNFVHDLQHQVASQSEGNDPRTTIWSKVEEIIKEVPPGAWKELPTDGSLNVDHYLYGSPKRER